MPSEVATSCASAYSAPSRRISIGGGGGGGRGEGHVRILGRKRIDAPYVGREEGEKKMYHPLLFPFDSSARSNLERLCGDHGVRCRSLNRVNEKGVTAVTTVNPKHPPTRKVFKMMVGIFLVPAVMYRYFFSGFSSAIIM